MFTREDFLIITGPEINRNNWQRNTNVKKVLDRYVEKLVKISSITKTMKQPEAVKISLVGTIMKLSFTPDLNRESKNGKLQMFQVEFEDRAARKHKKAKRNRRGGTFRGIFAAILLLLTVAFIGVWIVTSISKSTTPRLGYRSENPLRKTFADDYCQSSENAVPYRRQLDEVLGILQLQINDLYYQTRIVEKPDCIGGSLTIHQKERLFLKCLAIVWERIEFDGVLPEEYRKLRICRSNICSSHRYVHDPLCQQE